LFPFRTRTFLLIPIILFWCAALSAQNAQHSSITIHVGKTGLFSGLGHEHTVVAPIASGKIDAKAPSVQITVLAKQLKVTDTDVSAKDLAEVQETMLGPKVLDSDKYPEIRFQSSKVEPAGDGYFVIGTLSLHGTSRDLTFHVTGTPGHYHGKTKFKQTDFGIHPVSGGGGTVKVKDELEIDFDVFPADLAAPASH
jgi:polyisoprenoid-binding protein YceI